jgi:tRNA (Thr-GGU) A37 N-methylase
MPDRNKNPSPLRSVLTTQRAGEIRSPHDPAELAGDAHLVFIGRARTPWTSREDCPKNLREARERAAPARLELDAPWRPGLQGLQPGDPLVVLTWMDRGRRDLVVQAPRHRPEPAGVFALRSPVRPNPIGLHVVWMLAVEADGSLVVDVLDCLDGTPLLVWQELRPWVKLDFFNIFNYDEPYKWNTTVRLDPASPVDELGLNTGFIQGASFGQPTASSDYPRPYGGEVGGRVFRMAFGLRF